MYAVKVSRAEGLAKSGWILAKIELINWPVDLRSKQAKEKRQEDSSQGEAPWGLGHAQKTGT